MTESSPAFSFTALVRELGLAWKTLSVYPPGHQACEGATDGALRQLRGLAAPTGSFAVGVARNALVAGDERLTTPHAQQLARRLRELGIGVVRFAEGIPADELRSFLGALNRRPGGSGTMGGGDDDDSAARVAERLAAAGVGHVEVEAVDFSRLVATDALDVDGLLEEAGVDDGSLWQRILAGQMEGGVAAGTDGAPSLASVLELINRYLPRDLWGDGDGTAAGAGTADADPVGGGGAGGAATGGGAAGVGGLAGESPSGGGAAGESASATAGPLATGPTPDPSAGTGPDPSGASAAPEILALVRRLRDAVGEHAAEAAESGKVRWIRQVAELVGALPRGLREEVLDAALERLAADGAGEAAADGLAELSTTASASELVAALRRLRRHGRRFDAHTATWLDGLVRTGTLAAETSAVAAPDELRALLSEPEDRPALRADEPILSLPPSDPVLKPPSPALLDEMRGLDRAARAQQLLRTLLDLLGQAEDGEQAAAVAGRLEHLFLTLLQGLRLRAGTALVSHLRSLADERAGDPVGDAVAATLPRFGGDDTVQVLVDVLPALSGNDQDEVRQLVRQLGGGTARGLLVALGEEEDRSRRRLLFDLLSSMPEEVAGEARHLLADGRWFVVRNMIALLRAAEDREAVPDLRACLRHADARVRLEALRALTELDPELPRDLLDALLDDPDPKVAALAVQASGRLGGAAAVERLLEVVTPLDPLGRHRELRVRSLLALGAIGDPAVLPRIKRFFSAFSVDALEERRAAFKSLEGYPAAARAPWVAKGVKSRDAEIREACRRLARREGDDV